MKKLVIALMFCAGMAGAACYGPYCYDDTGANIKGGLALENGVTNNSAQVNNAPVGLWSRTAAQINTLTPGAAGQLIYCSDCVIGTGWDQICISSGTGNGAWVHISSKTIDCN